MVAFICIRNILVSHMANEETTFREGAAFPDEYGRERGIFTERDRRFLAGELEEELTDNQRRQKRYRLRKRLYHAIQDLAYLEYFDTEDLGLLAGQMSHASGEDKYQLPPGANRPEPDFDVADRMSSGTELLISFWREVYGGDDLRLLLSHSIHVDRALEHYQETGRYPLLNVSVDVEEYGDMSIQELRDIVWGRVPMREFPADTHELLRPSGFVLDLAGPDRGAAPPEPGDFTENGYVPKHPGLADAFREIVDSHHADREQPEIYDVVERVAESENVGFETAHEAFRDLIAGRGYAISDGKIISGISEAEE